MFFGVVKVHQHIGQAQLQLSLNVVSHLLNLLDLGRRLKIHLLELGLCLLAFLVVRVNPSKLEVNLLVILIFFVGVLFKSILFTITSTVFFTYVTGVFLVSIKSFFFVTLVTITFFLRFKVLCLCLLHIYNVLVKLLNFRMIKFHLHTVIEVIHNLLLVIVKVRLIRLLF